ncbi:MAG TPA: hypothetical protein VNC85_11790, partial [Mycobacteriales bacterium]|nr:hypothetical protein [Mycobacteriales bacterium]
MLPDQPRRRPSPRTHLGHGRLRRLQRRCHHDQSLTLPVELVTDGREQRRLARAGRTFHHDQSPVAGQSGERGTLTRVQPLDRDVEYVPGGEHADVFGCRRLAQRHTELDRAGGEVLGHLAAHRSVGHQTDAGEQLFDLAPQVRRVPRRPGSAQPRHDLQGGRVPVDPCGHLQGELDRRVPVAVSQPGQLTQPPLPQLVTRARDHLVRSVLGPRPRVPPAAQRRSRHGAWMLGSPLRFVPIKQRGDLRRAFGERADERGQLLDLTRPIEGVAMPGQGGTKPRITRDGGVPDAVDRRDRV